MIRQVQQSMSPRDIFRIFFRHRWRCVVFFLLIVALAVTGVLMMPRKYVSEAKFFVKVNLRFDPAATSEGQGVAMNLEREGEMRSVVALLGNRRLLESVVDELGTEAIFESDLQTAPLDRALDFAASLAPNFGEKDAREKREKAIRYLRKTIEIEHPKRSHVVTLSYESRSPERAQKVLDAFVKAAMEQHLDVNKNPHSYEFFASQAKLLKKQLLEAKQNLRDAKNEVGLVSLGSQRNVLEQHITNLDRELLNTGTELASTTDRIETLRSQLPYKLQKPRPGSALSTRSVDEMRNQLFTLEINYRELLSRFTNNHPRVGAVREQVEESKLLLRQQELLIELSRADSLRSKRKALKNDLEKTHQRLVAMNEDEIRIAELEREVTERAESHRVYVKKLEQARLDKQLESDRISNLRLAQEPTYMGKPLSRKGLLIAILAVVVGGVGALGVAYVSELLDESLVTPVDVESQLGVPVLMSLPRARSHRISLN